MNPTKAYIYCCSYAGPYFGEFYVRADANTDANTYFKVNGAYKDLPKAANGNCMYIDGDADF